MSELWTQLLTGESKKLTPLLTVDKVRLSRSTGEMEINFNAERLLTNRECKLIEEAMKNGFPKQKVSVNVNYAALKQQALEDINSYKSVVIDRVLRESPACMPFLMWDDADWSIQDGVLYIDISSLEGASFLKLRKADELIRDGLEKIFRLRLGVSIRFRGDEQALIDRIVEKRRLEAEELAREMIENAGENDSAAPVSSEAILGSPFGGEPLLMRDITEDAGKVTLLGEIISTELRDTKKRSARFCL